MSKILQALHELDQEPPRFSLKHSLRYPVSQELRGVKVNRQLLAGHDHGSYFLLPDFQDGIAIVGHRELKIALEDIVMAKVRLAEVATVVESETLARILLGGGDFVRQRGLEMGYNGVNHIEFGFEGGKVNGFTTFPGNVSRAVTSPMKHETAGSKELE
jgi:hypothetical protein